MPPAGTSKAAQSPSCSLRAVTRVSRRTRRNDIPDPQRGSEYLRERSHVRHDAEAVDAREREDGPSVIVEFVVVVVFDDHNPMCARELEQSQPSPGRHRDRRRELMVRRHVDGADGVLANRALQGVHLESVDIDRHADHGGAHQAKRFPGRSIAKLFDRHDVAWTDQRSREQGNGHLTPACDADVRWTGRQPPADANILDTASRRRGWPSGGP